MRLGLRYAEWGELSPRRTSMVLAVVIALICAAVANVLIANWRSDFDRASMEAANISAAMSQDIRRNIELFDLSLRGAAEDITNPAVRSAPDDLRQLILFDRAASASYLGKIIVIDADGKLIASSQPSEGRPPNYADRDYFLAHKVDANVGLYISQPLVSRLSGQQVIVFSRRITNPDGSFGGVVAGTLLVEYLHQLFQQMKLGRDGALTLLRDDGTVLMREPFDPALIGVRRAPPTLFDLASRSDEGQYRGRSVMDGVRRLFHFHRVGKLPLIVSVGLSLTDIHRDWWWRATLIGLVVALSCGLIALLNVKLARELRSRVKAEAALVALVDKDGLTGLANRRCFDRELQAEWRRAMRQRAPFSLLMVDVDDFKAFNDHLGHAAGDVALCHVAECLAAHAGTPGALAARYGGEEFALILPGSARPEALKVAERLRRAVLQLGLTHPASSHGQLTVSLGCASADPALGGTVDALCASADAALYRSKRLGRNIVSEAPPPEAMRLAS